MGARVALILHAHLPWVVGEGTWPHGETWLHEAVSESYLPLLASLQQAGTRGHRRLLSLEFSPVLCEQLGDPGWQGRFRSWLGQQQHAARTDRSRFESAGDVLRSGLAARWEMLLRARLHQWDALGAGLLEAFAELHREGVLELFAGAASHAYLPLLSHPGHVGVQVSLGLASHRRHFGMESSGFWLPECAHRGRFQVEGFPTPGLDEFLQGAGVRWTVLDPHLAAPWRAPWPGGSEPRLRETGVDSGSPGPPSPGALEAGGQAGGPLTPAPLEPFWSDNSWRSPQLAPLTVLARDVHACEQVWSAHHGFPGDPNYLEYHWRHPESGLRYCRITGRPGLDGDKQAYLPAQARRSVRRHAAEFVRSLASPPAGTCVLALDAELFGHWWHEGADFLLEFWESCAQLGVRTVTGGDLASSAAHYREIAEGSWGEGGDHRTWNSTALKGAWSGCHLRERRMRSLAGRLRGQPASHPAHPQARRAALELLMLSSSDWPFLISRGTAADYARARQVEHFRRFDRAASSAERSLSHPEIPPQEPVAVAYGEAFPELDPCAFSGPAGAPDALT